MSFTHILRAVSTAVLLLPALVSDGQGPPVTIPSMAPPQPVTALEYYFDTDPGAGNAIPVTITPGLLVSTGININTATLAPGVHRFFIRARNGNGSWSLSTCSILYVLNPALDVAGNTPPPAITTAEYFLDNDPGFGNGIPIAVTAGNVINLSGIALNMSSLGQGAHKLYIRTKDQKGSWSHTQNAVLNIVDGALTLPPNVAPVPIVKAEYFFDTDPGFSNGINIPVTAGTTVSLSDITAVSNLPAGMHRYFVRTQDQRGNWSLSSSGALSIVSATIDLQPHAAQAPVKALEYFIDNDPGFGNGTISVLTPSANLANYALSVPVAGLPDGTHQLYIRTLGPASITTVQTFYVGIPLPLNFLDFSVKKEGSAGHISWEIAPAFRADHFEVERSTDGKHFSRLTTTAFRNGVTRYVVWDRNPGALDVPIVYYRVAVTGQDGKTAYTGILSLRLNEDAQPYAYIFPNPVKDMLTVQVALKDEAKLHLLLVDNAGRFVLQEEKQLSGSLQQVALDVSAYPAGIYHLILTSGNWKKNIKILKQ